MSYQKNNKKFFAISLGGAALIAIIVSGAGCSTTPSAPSESAEPSPTPPTTVTQPPSISTPSTQSTTSTALGVNPAAPLVENIGKIEDLFTFTAALQDAGIIQNLSESGPFTIFAPRNSAFDKLSSSTIKALLGNAQRGNLIKLLNFHIVSGSFESSNLRDGQELRAMNGETVTIRKKNDRLMINDANIIAPDLVSSNGTLYIIDTVLIPNNFQTTTSPARL